MGDYNLKYIRQKDIFVEAISKVKGLRLIEPVNDMNISKIGENDIDVSGFPLKFSIEYKIKDIGEVFLDILMNEEETHFDRVEIVSIDIWDPFKKKGYGKCLIEQVKVLAKELNIYIYGEGMRNSIDFYKSCDFNVSGLSFSLYI